MLSMNNLYKVWLIDRGIPASDMNAYTSPNTVNHPITITTHIPHPTTYSRTTYAIVWIKCVFF